MLNRPSVCDAIFCLAAAYDDGGLGIYNGFDWYGRVLEVREV